MTSFMDDIHVMLCSARDNQRALAQSKYLKMKFSFFGIQKPNLVALQRDLFKKYPIATEAELIALIKVLWSKNEREYHYTACALAQKYHHLWTPAILELFDTMLRTNSWWDTVDTIAPHLVGSLAMKFPDLKATIQGWIKDENMWVRRAALLYQLRYKQNTDYAVLFSLCQKTMHEKEFFIRKAIGWSLREYSKIDPIKVRAFYRRK